MEKRVDLLSKNENQDNRMIDNPHIYDIGTLKSPRINIQEFITQPDEIYSSYRKLFTSNLRCAFIFTLGSLLFDIILPFLIAIFIKFKYNDIDGSNYDNINILLSIALFANVFSSVCEWVREEIYLIGSKRMGDNIYYDLFYN